MENKQERGERCGRDARGELVEPDDLGERCERDERSELGEPEELGERCERDEMGEPDELGEQGERCERPECGELGEPDELGEPGERWSLIAPIRMAEKSEKGNAMDDPKIAVIENLGLLKAKCTEHFCVTMVRCNCLPLRVKLADLIDYGMEVME